MSATQDTIDERDALAALGRNWGVLLFVGVLTLLVGLACVIWTSKTVTFLAIIFGFYLLISGIFQVVQSFASERHKALFAISGILSIILGVYFFKAINNDNQAAILALFIGLAWLFRGITELIVGLQSKGEDGRGWLITGGILLILGAMVVFVYPTLVVSTLVWITGFVLIIVGISQIVGAFQVKKLAGV
jgi:uncharacterized membrane protein HdeD (DUF308 family)